MRLGALISIFVCICILLCGCGEVVTDNSSFSTISPIPTEHKYNMHLIYDQTDTFNPYTAESKQNREICQLLYEPLVALDNNFMPIMKIASSVKVDGKNCTIQFKNVRFSDGSTLTSDDVIYSIASAKAVGSNFAAALNIIDDFHAMGANTISITLKKADPYFANLLTFPIIKQKSDTLKGEDNLPLPPTGCGRYVLDETRTSLEYNKLYYGATCNIKKIGLINAPDGESAEHYISSGAVTVCYDDYSDNSVPRMSGRKTSVPLNNFVYLGINMQNPFLRDKYFRYAISSAINRTKIVNDAYYGNAIVANGPFNPSWTVCSGLQTLEKTNNNEIAIVNLEKIGYNNLNDAGYRLTSSGKQITLSLLVNSDNQARVATGQLIVKQLAAVGIEVVLKAVPYQDYLSQLNSRSFDLYVAEARLSDNMDLSELIKKNGSMAFGIVGNTENDASSTTSEENMSGTAPAPTDINLTAASAVSGFYGGKYTLSDVVNAFLSEMPIIPLCYRCGVTMSSPKLATEPISTANDIFFNINNYSFKN